MTDIERPEAPNAAEGEPLAVAEARSATVDDAVDAALRELRLDRSEVAVEVLTEGAMPLPGEQLLGSDAHVRVRRLDQRTARGRRLLSELLALMGIPARVEVRAARPAAPGSAPPPAILDVSGDDLGLLIGWRGETLRAVQTVLNLMMGDDHGGERRLILDVERYRARREEQVRDLARRMADRVRRTGQRHMLDPMHGYERRAVHICLEREAGIRTESVGTEPARRVVIHPDSDRAAGS